MTWFKIDDQFALHPKVIRAGNEAVGAWARMGAWSCSHLTDGAIPNDVAEVFSGGSDEVLKRLVMAKMLVRTEDGYQMHDFLDWNPSSKEVKRQRKAVSAVRSKAGSKGAERRWQSDGKRDGKTMAPIPSPIPSPDQRSESEATGAAAPPPPPAKTSRPRKPSETFGPREETLLQVAWRCWRAEYHDRYGHDYTAPKADGPIMARVAAGALAETKRQAPNVDVGEALESMLRHTYRGYLRSPGNGDYLLHERHPLRCIERDISKHGSPWTAPKPAPPKPPEPQFTPEQLAANRKRAAELFATTNRERVERGYAAPETTT